MQTGESLDDDMLIALRLVDAESKKLTNAGVIFADNCPFRHSRLFCVRWNGLTKAGGFIDALDSAEFTGSIIKLLDDGLAFIRRNNRSSKSSKMPDYDEQSYRESLINALVHRSYRVLGSEVHIDIFDDRMTIYSPGGAIDGLFFQDITLANVSSKVRNPIIANMFTCLGYMEQKGRGLENICLRYQAYTNMHVITSTASSFFITLPNLNY